MQLFGIRKQPGESYLDLYRRIDNARNWIDRITPATQTKEQRSDEIALCSLLSSLPMDDPLRRQLVAQKDVTLDDAYSSFLRTDKDTAVARRRWYRHRQQQQQRQ